MYEGVTLEKCRQIGRGDDCNVRVFLFQSNFLDHNLHHSEKNREIKVQDLLVCKGHVTK